MHKRVVSTGSFEVISYGEEIKDYNNQKWIFAGVMDKEVIVQRKGSDVVQVMYPSIFDLLIIE